MRGARDENGTQAVTAARFALVGVVIYAAIHTGVLVFLRPHFSLLHNPESDYGSKGSWAWLMDLNFLLRCALKPGHGPGDLADGRRRATGSESR